MKSDHNTSKLALAVASCPSQRANMTLFTSYSDTIDWKRTKTVWPGYMNIFAERHLCTRSRNLIEFCFVQNGFMCSPSGYVDLISISEDRVALLFENGETTFADRISFQIIDL